MKRNPMIAWLLSAVMLAGILPETTLAEEKPTYANYQDDTSDCGFTEENICRHKIHTKECYTKEYVCLMEEKTASKSDADIPHEHTQDCYKLDCLHERGIHTTDNKEQEDTPDFSGQNIPKATDSNAAQPLMAAPYAISGDGYSFDENNGELKIFNDEGTAGWKSNSNIDSSDIISVVVENGVTKIKEKAFMDCKNLSNLDFSGCNSLETIESSAFRGCINLELDTLPDQVKIIGSQVFEGCTKITSLTLSNVVAPALGKDAFNGIPNLTFFVPYNATGYDGENWPKERVVYGAALSDLTINSGTLSPDFFPGRNIYGVLVDNSVERVSLTPYAHNKETITVNGIPVNSGAASGDIELVEGRAIVIIVEVKNSDEDKRTYMIHVSREWADSIPVKGVELNHTALTLYTNQSPESAQLSAVVKPEDATNQTVTWSSSAPDIVKVDNNGLISAVSPGGAIITATTVEGGKTASCMVTVVEETTVMTPVTGVTLNLDELTLYTNKAPDTFVLSAEIQPGNATNQTVIWSSSAPDIAAVDGSGKVRAISPGLAVITVTTVDGGRTASCAVTVKQKSSSSGSGNEGSNGSTGYYYRVLTDKATGITVTGNQINSNAVLTVKPDTLHQGGDSGCDILRTAQVAGRVLSFCDISLSHGFLGNVTVTISVEGRDGQALTAVHCVGGNLALVNVIVENGMVTVTVDSLSPIALLNNIYTLDTLTAPQIPESAALPPDTDKMRRYRVKKGDTLSALAQRYHCTVAEIVAANQIIKNPNLILPGWVLKIPINAVGENQRV